MKNDEHNIRTQTDSERSTHWMIQLSTRLFNSIVQSSVDNPPLLVKLQSHPPRKGDTSKIGHGPRSRLQSHSSRTKNNPPHEDTAKSPSPPTIGMWDGPLCGLGECSKCEILRDPVGQKMPLSSQLSQSSGW